MAVLGLKTLFAVFMGKGLDLKEKRKKNQNELEGIPVTTSDRRTGLR